MTFNRGLYTVPLTCTTDGLEWRLGVKPSGLQDTLYISHEAGAVYCGHVTLTDLVSDAVVLGKTVLSWSFRLMRHNRARWSCITNDYQSIDATYLPCFSISSTSFRQPTDRTPTPVLPAIYHRLRTDMSVPATDNDDTNMAIDRMSTQPSNLCLRFVPIEDAPYWLPDDGRLAQQMTAE